MCWSTKAALFACALGQLLLTGRTATAAPLCGTLSYRPSTIHEVAAQCPIIIYAKLEASRKEPGPLGSTSFVVINILKSDPAIVDRKTVAIPRYIEIRESKNPPNYLLFADVDKNGQLDFFRGIPGTSALSDYTQGLLKLDAKDRSKLLKYCFDYLDHGDQAVAKDALDEFIKADDAELRAVAKSVNSDKLRRWLRDEKTPLPFANICGLLLGLCGAPPDAALLRQYFDSHTNAQRSLQGLLAGYTMLAPKEAWSRAIQTMNNPKEDFSKRYLVFANARYFHSSPPGIITEQQIFDVMKRAIECPDMADLAIEDLWRWKCWNYTDTILSLADKKEFEHPMIRRSILRYALACPADAAKKYADNIRKNDPKHVTEIEEAIKYDKP